MWKQNYKCGRRRFGDCRSWHSISTPLDTRESIADVTQETAIILEVQSNRVHSPGRKTSAVNVSTPTRKDNKFFKLKSPDFDYQIDSTCLFLWESFTLHLHLDCNLNQLKLNIIFEQNSTQILNPHYLVQIQALGAVGVRAHCREADHIVVVISYKITKMTKVQLDKFSILSTYIYQCFTSFSLSFSFISFYFYFILFHFLYSILIMVV